MSLIAWYPLNGDLKNRGVGDMELTSTSTSYVDGKIGKSILFDGNTWALASWKYGNLDEFSISMWVYADSTQIGCLGACRSAVGVGFAIFLIDGNNVRFDIGDTQLWYTGYILPKSTWYHLTFTRSKTKAVLYVNGIETKSITYSSKNAANFGNIFSFGASLVNGENYYNFMRGKFNDYRIYNHCLSPKEVKEISKGLVLHYPLNLIDGYIGGRNLARSTSNKWKSYSSFNGNTNICPSIGLTYIDKLSVGDTITISLDYEWENIVPVSGKTAKCWIQGSGNVTEWNSDNFPGTNSLTLSGSGSKHYEYTYTLTEGSKKNTYWRPNIRHDYIQSGTVRWKNFKVEKGSTPTPWTPAPEDVNYDPIVYDCSGYGNDGTIKGTLLSDNDTPVGLCSTKFNGSTTDIIEHNVKSAFNFTKDFSWSAWIKNPGNTGTNYAFTSGRADAGGYGFGLQLFNNSVSFWFGNNSKTVNVTNNTWTHLAMSVTGTNAHIYVNGKDEENFTPSTLPTYSDGGGLGIGCFHYASNIYGGTFDICDFRIYSTALSADDIKELYQTKFVVTNNGTMFATEYIESDKVKFNKSGVLNASNLTENPYILDMPVKILDDGSVWARIFYHNNKSGTKLFSSSDKFATEAVIKDEDRYSRLYLMENFKSSDGFEFLVHQPDDGNGTWRWKLTNNPVTSTSAGTVTGVSGYSNDSKGLMLHSPLYETWLSHSKGPSDWWCAIGSVLNFNSGLPGWGGKIVKGRLELWVRIDKMTMKDSNASVSNNALSAKQLIEN